MTKRMIMVVILIILMRNSDEEEEAGNDDDKRKQLTIHLQLQLVHWQGRREGGCSNVVPK